VEGARKKVALPTKGPAKAARAERPRSNGVEEDESLEDDVEPLEVPATAAVEELVWVWVGDPKGARVPSVATRPGGSGSVVWPAWRSGDGALVLIMDPHGPQPKRAFEVPAESVLPWREGLVACMHTREEKRGVAMLKAASRAMKMSGAPKMRPGDVDVLAQEIVRETLAEDEQGATEAATQVTVVDYAPPWRALKDSGVYEDHYRVLGGGGEEWVRAGALRPALKAEARAAKRRWLEASRRVEEPAALWDAPMLAAQAYLARPLSAAERLGLLQTCQLLLLRGIVRADELAEIYAALGAQDLGLHARA